MVDEQHTAQAPHNDEQYKQATKAVVDDMFRVDVLGPRICAVLTEHTPASNKIHELLADAIIKEPKVIQAIEVVVQGLDTKRKSRWIDKAIGAAGGIVVTVIITVLVFGLEQRLPSGQSQPQTNTTSTFPTTGTFHQ